MTSRTAPTLLAIERLKTATIAALFASVACAVESSDGSPLPRGSMSGQANDDAAMSDGSADSGVTDSTDSSLPDQNAPVAPEPDAGNSQPDSGVQPPPDVTVGPARLPFAVDDYYVPSGFMGDGEATTGAVVWTGGMEAACQSARSHSDAVGDCHELVYVPAAIGWGGIYWQYPINNWGSKPGLLLPQGAQAVSFYAKGNQGGERITFLSGGVGSGETNYQDSVRISEIIELTVDWQEYHLTINQAYTEVIGGFGWVASAADNGGGVSFSIDDIRWE